MMRTSARPRGSINSPLCPSCAAIHCVSKSAPSASARVTGNAKRPLMDMENLVSLCKRRGFIFQSSEIYGGLNGFWDYGPLGVELKRNLKDFWWRRNVREREDMVGMDGSI